MFLLKTENNNLYGLTFAHFDKLLIKVDEDPNPQFLLKLSFHKLITNTFFGLLNCVHNQIN